MKEIEQLDEYRSLILDIQSIEEVHRLHVGIIGHDRVLVSLASAHFISQWIKENKKFSINLVDEAMLPKADYAGAVSGRQEDKSDLFSYEIGVHCTPLISAAPLTMECTVEDIYETEGFESFRLINI